MLNTPCRCWVLSETLHRLRVCQKRGICGLLGVDDNSRLDVIDAASGCPPFEVRRLLLRTRRDRSIRGLWFSADSDAFALTYVMRGLFGNDAIVSSPDDAVPLTQLTSTIFFDNFTEPLSRSLATYSDNTLTLTAIRRIVIFPSDAGRNQLILYWCLSKWRNFRTVTCQNCGSFYQQQEHIVECSDLPFRLLTDPRLDVIQVHPDNPLKIVEAYVTSISELLPISRDMYSSLLQVLGDHIWESIRLVCGVGTEL